MVYQNKYHTIWYVANVTSVIANIYIPTIMHIFYSLAYVNGIQTVVDIMANLGLILVSIKHLRLFYLKL